MKRQIRDCSTADIMDPRSWGCGLLPQKIGPNNKKVNGSQFVAALEENGKMKDFNCLWYTSLPPSRANRSEEVGHKTWKIMRHKEIYGKGLQMRRTPNCVEAEWRKMCFAGIGCCRGGSRERRDVLKRKVPWLQNLLKPITYMGNANI